MISIIVPHFKILYRVIVSTHVLDFRRFLRTVFRSSKRLLTWIVRRSFEEERGLVFPMVIGSNRPIETAVTQWSNVEHAQGINFSQSNANFSLKISKEHVIHRKISWIKLKCSGKSVKGTKSREKEKLFKHEGFSSTVILFNITKNVTRF